MTDLWYNNPSILFQDLAEFFPTNNLTNIEKVNAIARLLSMGNPVKTKGADGEEQVAGEGAEPEEASDAPAPEEEEAEETES
jgi:hypothetical protein